MTDKKLEYEKTKREWNYFGEWYWLVFVLVVLSRLCYLFFKNYSSEIALMFGVVEFILKLAMVFVVGIYSYRITNKKRFLCVGLLGGLWVGFVLNLLSYWVVKFLYHKKQAGLI